MKTQPNTEIWVCVRCPAWWGLIHSPYSSGLVSTNSWGKLRPRTFSFNKVLLVSTDIYCWKQLPTVAENDTDEWRECKSKPEQVKNGLLSSPIKCCPICFVNDQCPHFKRSCMSPQQEHSQILPDNHPARYLHRSALSLSWLFCTQTVVISQIQKPTHCKKKKKGKLL